ncbi:FAD:protein FMN transferase [Undibacterium fentianense]|uniref:FAD:protein FMN transferase n=1 Tax=Undibacterium fentianense TaxID=2828728 RepID=A0A941E279_9BURK|nr:FAD:protein FMN transferase [Undibacterium fentianense]MBR7799304.1 FAD:protein FMN transferase [Undibacterium fentianense]
MMSIHRHPFKAMACDCEIVIASQPDSATPSSNNTNGDSAESLAVKCAIEEVLRIQQKYSRYSDMSVISQINQAAGYAPVEVDTETWSLLNYADILYRSSRGRFDITAGVLRQVWRFDEARLPSEADLAAYQNLIGWTDVERHDQQIKLPKVGMELDFGGFGKEYAVDRAAQKLMENGIKSGYVNLGGDLRVIGPKPDGSDWQIGIQNPRAPEQILATMPIAQGALATSGDYQRYFDLDGQRYCHILNPQTGWPVRYWRSISVTAPLASMAGSCTTIAMLLEADGLEFLEQAGVNYLAVDHAGLIYQTKPLGP